MKNKPSHPIRLLLRETRENGYYHLNAGVVEVEVEDGEKIRSAHEAGGLFVANLAVTSQGNDDDREKRDGGRHVYGWGVRFRDVYCVERREAEGMVGTFKALERKMAKLDAQHGRPVSFAQYLGRVALALGAEGFVIQKAVKPGGFGNYDDFDWLFLTLADGIDMASDLIVRWQKGA